MSGQVRILGVGVATMDIYVNKRRMYPGGNEFNVVCHAARLGAQTGFLGAFGNDLAGALLEKTLQDCGVDTSLCRHEHGSSGYSLVELREDGDRVFLDWNHQGVTDRFPVEFTERELAYCRDYQVLSAGRCADVSVEKLRLLKEAGIPVCYDFHAAYTPEEIAEIAPLVRYAFFSCSHLTEAEIHVVLQQAVDCGCCFAVGTRGCEPVVACVGGSFLTQETRRVTPTDTLGAGDSYIAGVLVGYLRRTMEGIPEEEALQAALAEAADYSAQVVCIEGSLGFGYDADPDRLGEIVNLQEQDESQTNA